MTTKPTTPDPDAEAEALAAAEAQAKADAEAEALAAAEAQAKADAEAAKVAKPAKKAKPKMASADDLRAAIARVEAGNHANGRTALVEGLVQDGAKIEDRDNAVHIDWLGVKMQTTAGLPNALTVWCSKARRAILNGEAE